jgi:hypothetical protein
LQVNSKASASRSQVRRSEAYGRAALDRECAAIANAPKGEQEKTRHRACFAIGRLVGGGVIAEAEALSRLKQAARRMPAYGERWADLERKVEASFRRGVADPRGLPGGRAAPSSPVRTGPDKANVMPQSTGGGSTTTADALRLWAEGVDPRGTPAEVYLNSRALDLSADLAGEVLRWHPRTGALLALFRAIATGEPQAVSRIFLDPHGCKTGRKFFGPVAGAAIMLDPFDEVTHALHVGEGVETGMAARQLGLRPCWALGDAGAIERLPVLDGVECLTILAEVGCAANAKAVEACGCRWRNAGREVQEDRSLFGKDLNDALMLKRKGRANPQAGATSMQHAPDEAGHVETPK